jgi:hypothetical protein
MPFFAIAKRGFRVLGVGQGGEPETLDFAKDLVEALTPIGE